MVAIAAIVGLSMLLASRPARNLFRGESAPAAVGAGAALVILLALTKAG
ncbi:MAG: hypothetical protein ACKVVT_10140 [Dehalococcoidia bacterium]